ncbi:hypothetical protein [Halomarina oriensis]|uniref:Uncharacterized protein n=1 Tax=Halomarina oriensis TaxID=671145 RepID=A0A6B0GMR9_9EURY|nr:hypothetical protein [Halomarina oriensis]MWG36162.1 hypothetical protein [Halomarina oriensis]
MPETIAPEPDDAAESDLEADAEAAETTDEDEEGEFFIPAPGGLRGL